MIQITPSPLDTSPASTQRVSAIDLVRGLVIVLMALDHTHHYFSNFAYSQTDLDHTTIAQFFTRWITHFCAPAFILLAGTGAGLARQQDNDTGALSRFLAVRGFWLIGLELVVVRLAWSFDPGEPVVRLGVLWAIGASMMALAALIHLPRKAIWALALIMIAGHNLLDPLSANDVRDWARETWSQMSQTMGLMGETVWALVHDRERVRFGGFTLHVQYPLVPWIGVMALGYLLAGLYSWPAEARRRALLWAGGAMVMGFVLIRALNGYGDRAPWAPQGSLAFTALSFLDTSKYPPSLAFLLMTLGPVLALLAISEHWRGRAAGFLITFGRAPLFFYLVHLYVIHAGAVVLGVVQGFGAGPFFAFYRDFPDAYGLSLVGVYAVWSAIVAALYPLCAWWSQLKRRHPKAWIRFL